MPRPFKSRPLDNLNDDEILDFLSPDNEYDTDYADESDENYENDDIDDDDFLPSAGSTQQQSTSRSNGNTIVTEGAIEYEIVEISSTLGYFEGSVMAISNSADQFKKAEWTQRNVQIDSSDLTFFGNVGLSEDIKSLSSPADFFKYFVSDELLTEIANQSNLYAHQKNVKTTFNVERIDIRKFVGILLYMSIYRYPNVRSYWGRYKFEAIHSTTELT